MKVAVIYYSFEGNTKMVASKIAEKFNADIFELEEIKSRVPKTGFFKYAWGGKQVVMKEKPELKKLNINIDDYDLIFIGTPVWSFTYAPAIRSFFSKYTIKDKNVAVFCCHGGGPSKTIQNMKDCLDGNKIITEFDIVDPLNNVEVSNKKIQEWLDSIDEK